METKTLKQKQHTFDLDRVLSLINHHKSVAVGIDAYGSARHTFTTYLKSLNKQLALYFVLIPIEGPLPTTSTGKLKESFIPLNEAQILKALNEHKTLQSASVALGISELSIQNLLEKKGFMYARRWKIIDTQKEPIPLS